MQCRMSVLSRVLLGATVVASACVPGTRLADRTDRPGVFVLGVDGMDPQILDRLMREGKMPNFTKLAAEGSYQRLGTSNPPQSPVAWSTFVTGLDPGGHGIFDFVHRDPKTYQPIASSTPPAGEPGKAIEFFGYYLPIGGEAAKNNRSGIPFWDSLHAAGVDVEVYRMPGNYPPTPSEAKVLSGMGTVDMRGGYGVYTWYTDQPVAGRKDIKGDIQLVSVQDEDLDGTPDTVRGSLRGPPDIFRIPPGHQPGDGDYLSVPVTVRIDPENDVALVEAGGSRAVLVEGEWSDWMDVRFDALPAGLMPLMGMVRFYAKELRPAFHLYASPVNISPARPAQPITTPEGFAPAIAEAMGPYYTQGMPEETNALKDRMFDDADYAAQVKLVQHDAMAMLELALSRFSGDDMTFFYLSDIDLQCHMLWRHGDPKYPDAPPHPAREESVAHAHAHDIEGYYRHVDELLGRVRERLPADTALIVMSDHGFQPFTREIHLNAWLRDHGWLVLKDGARTGRIAAGDVDWSKTRAYGLGFNSIYLNLAGREAEGIVQPDEAKSVMSELSRQLLAFGDPQERKKPVRRVFRGSDAFRGARVAEAPDLIVGYDVGYGASDLTTLGEITEDVIADNTSRWSGNHLMDPEVVPGVVLSNRKLAGDGYDLVDVTATILAWYGLQPNPGMEGTSIF
jgi:predicted AlkP superfamily phosphohydrolase/phosphomutase